MFQRVLIAGTVLLAAACVPISPQPAGPCISDERALLIGESVETEPSDELPGYIDIVKVESELYRQVLTVVLHLRDIPEELTFNREGMNNNRIEYSWMVLISESGYVEPWAGEVERMTRFRYHLMTAHFTESDEARAPTSGSIASYAESDVWAIRRDEGSEEEHSWYAEALWEARIEASHELDTLTMTGYVPDVASEHLLVIETYDYLRGRDRIRCDSALVSAQRSSVPETEIATPTLPSPKADLNDLASVLAEMDESEGSEMYAALLREFSDCFIGKWNAGIEEEKSSDGSRSEFTPAQITAVTLFQAGVFAIVGELSRARLDERANPSPYTLDMYELLAGALAICKDSG